MFSSRPHLNALMWETPSGTIRTCVHRSRRSESPGPDEPWGVATTRRAAAALAPAALRSGRVFGYRSCRVPAPRTAPHCACSHGRQPPEQPCVCLFHLLCLCVRAVSATPSQASIPACLIKRRVHATDSQIRYTVQSGAIKAYTLSCSDLLRPQT